MFGPIDKPGGSRQPQPWNRPRSTYNQRRRGGRVVDGSGLENRHTRKGIGGSNPSLSASESIESITYREFPELTRVSGQIRRNFAWKGTGEHSPRRIAATKLDDFSVR